MHSLPGNKNVPVSGGQAEHVTICSSLSEARQPKHLRRGLPCPPSQAAGTGPEGRAVAPRGQVAHLHPSHCGCLGLGLAGELRDCARCGRGCAGGSAAGSFALFGKDRSLRGRLLSSFPRLTPAVSWGHGLVEVVAVARVVPGHLSPLLSVSLPGGA